MAGLLRSAPGEAQCPISFLLRYGDVWTNWRSTSSYGGAGKEQTLQVAAKEDIVAISGYSWDKYGHTASLHNVLIQGSVVVMRQFLIFTNQTFLMVSVALVTMVD